MTNRTSPVAGVEAGFPIGTVTFLFSDIEGSTALVRKMGTANWTPVLERHRQVIRTALAATGGREVLTEGDSFFVVFINTQDAVRAAVEIQRKLAAEAWPDGVAIAVRIGLHTGEGELDADDTYVGTDVHRAARIAAAGHGGQVLLSETTSALVKSGLPPGVALSDLGEHRLKDLAPERLSQLRVEGLRSDFPPVKAVDRSPNNLPMRVTSFVGRDAELAETVKLLGAGRLLTLTGPGGIGKTSMSLQLAATAAENFPGGVWFVPLEPIRDIDLVAPTIARTIGISIDSAGSSVLRIAEWIGDKKLLLVLDNYEQVIDAAHVVSDLLEVCPELKIICTSRSALKVAGEQEYEVPGLPAPPDLSRLSLLDLENLPESTRHAAPESLSQYEAVRLFIARATSVKADFKVTNQNAPAVAQISARLGGMPLAIELAAARIKVLSPQQILERLENHLALLTSSTRDRPKRQRTLRGAIAWSFDLLDGPSRTLAERLSVFNGGWDLSAAEEVAGGDGVDDVLTELEALADHSLVRREEVDGVIRFDMFPTIREFMWERLREDGDAAESADRHTRYYTNVAEKAAPQLHGDDQRVWMDRLEREHDNLRTALERATAKPDPDMAVRLAFAMWRFWQQRGYVREARRRLESLLNETWDLPDVSRARLLEAAGGIAYWQADHPATVKWYGEALQIWRKLDNKAEIGNAMYNYVFAELLPAVSGSAMSAEDLAAGVEASMEALQLYRDGGNRIGEGNVMWALGSLHFFAGRDQESRQWFERARTVFSELGQRTMEAWANYMSALPLVRLGQVAEAGRLARSALRHFNNVGDLPGVAQTLRNLSAIAIMNGDKPKAGRLHGAAEKLLETTGAGLTGFYEAILAEYDPRVVLNEEDLSRFGAEGAALPLGETVRLAMEPD